MNKLNGGRSKYLDWPLLQRAAEALKIPTYNEICPLSNIRRLQWVVEALNTPTKMAHDLHNPPPRLRRVAEAPLRFPTNVWRTLYAIVHCITEGSGSPEDSDMSESICFYSRRT